MANTFEILELGAEIADLKQQLAEANTIIAVYRRTTESIAAARERERVLMSALVRLESAAEIFMADQSRATDPRVGLVQPVSVAECDELSEAIRVARQVLRQLDSTEGEGKDE